MSAKELYIIIQMNLNFLSYVMPSIFHYIRFSYFFVSPTQTFITCKYIGCAHHLVR